MALGWRTYIAKIATRLWLYSKIFQTDSKGPRTNKRRAKVRCTPGTTPRPGFLPILSHRKSLQDRRPAAIDGVRNRSHNSKIRRISLALTEGSKAMYPTLYPKMRQPSDWTQDRHRSPGVPRFACARRESGIISALSAGRRTPKVKPHAVFDRVGLRTGYFEKSPQVVSVPPFYTRSPRARIRLPRRRSTAGTVLSSGW